MRQITSVTTPISQLLSQGQQAKSRHPNALALTLSLSLLLSACAGLQGLVDGIRPATSGHVIAVNAEVWTISFQPDADTEVDAPVVPGELLIQKRGQTVQTIAHRLSRDTLREKDDSWLQVADVNNDGLPDFLLTHAQATPEESPVKSLYLFDAESQSFQLQKKISNLGDIDKLSGCVVVTTTMDKSPQRTYCFSDEQPGWVEIKIPNAIASERCNIKTHKLADCRGLRNQRDGEMRNLVGSYIATRSKAMVEEKRKAAAQRFARNLRVGHEQWLMYRDARCASYVIEYNFPANTSGFEMESCKLDLSGLQLQHYASMLASLDK